MIDLKIISDTARQADTHCKCDYCRQQIQLAVNKATKPLVEVLELAHAWFVAVRIDGNICIAGEDATIRAEIDVALAAHRKEHG